MKKKKKNKQKLPISKLNSITTCVSSVSLYPSRLGRGKAGGTSRKECKSIDDDGETNEPVMVGKMLYYYGDELMI